MIRPCTDADFDTIFAIVNEAAEAYRGVIPADRWHEPYMPREQLRHEIESGVRFWGYEEGGQLLGVMGIQDVQDVTLIRHAYVRTANRGQGIGGKLLAELRKLTTRPVLIGTWAAATWAIRFYEKHGFKMVTPEEKDRFLKKYWSIPERQVATSVLLPLPETDPTTAGTGSHRPSRKAVLDQGKVPGTAHEPCSFRSQCRWRAGHC
jgi:N-acetylglutamate synthase-like GNAT family acetyltransferase